MCCVAQRSYYTAQTTLVQTKATAGHNRVALYQSLGGDTLLQTAPVCPVDYVNGSQGATLATNCSRTVTP